MQHYFITTRLLDWSENGGIALFFAISGHIAIRSNCTNERIMAQGEMFTIHGVNLMDLEKLCPNAVKKIIINNVAVPEIKEFWEIANINQVTVFSDLHGCQITYEKGRNKF